MKYIGPTIKRLLETAVEGEQAGGDATWPGHSLVIVGDNLARTTTTRDNVTKAALV